MAKRPELMVMSGELSGKRFPVPETGLRLGRSSSNDLHLPDEELSRNHCLFEADGEDGIRVLDLASANGTFVNGEPLGATARKLSVGDRIEVGSSLLVVVGEGESVPAPKAVAAPAPDGAVDLGLGPAKLASDEGAAAKAHCLDALSGAGTLDLANNALTVHAPSASDFPCLSAKGATLDLGGKEATTHRLDGFVTVKNGVLVLDGDWTLAKAEVQDPDAVSAGIAFSSTSRLVLSEADQRQLSDEMPAGGYLLATGVTGCPRFSKAADAKIALFARDGHLILGRNPGTMVIVR